MIVYKGFKTKIYPNKEQIEYFNECFGISRFAYNWYLENNQKYYEEGNRKSFYDNELNLERMEEVLSYVIGKLTLKETLKMIRKREM